MPRADHLTAVVRLASPIVRSPRVMQLEGLFDVPRAARSERNWHVRLRLPKDWQVGLIVGPSGCGKTTLAHAWWPDEMAAVDAWPSDRSILDGFPAAAPIKEIVDLLCSVGFSSPPSWLRPFCRLSTGEQFRVSVARALAESPELAVIDEFTSTVDRGVARIASAAIARTIRRLGRRIVAVTCHFDVAEWLDPDWIYRPESGEFTAGRSLCRGRPAVELEIARVHPEAWELFKAHHYLSARHANNARTFVASVWGRPAAFISVHHFPHPVAPSWKVHRLVCLPDFQGIGIGCALLEYAMSLYRALGKPCTITTSHPGLVRTLASRAVWRCTRAPSLGNYSASMGKVGLLATKAFDRLTTTFRYLGPARPEDAAAFGLCDGREER